VPPKRSNGLFLSLLKPYFKYHIFKKNPNFGKGIAYFASGYLIFYKLINHAIINFRHKKFNHQLKAVGIPPAGAI